MRYVRKIVLYYYHIVIKNREEKIKNVRVEVSEMFKKKLEIKNEILKKIELTDKIFLLIDDQEEIPKIFKSSWTYLKSFLEHLYTSPKMVSKIISISNIEDIKEYIAPFFANNFYENILSSKSLEKYLIYIIYLLLKDEIDSLDDYNECEKFLEETPCGYILEQLIEKIDIKSFCKINILRVIQDLEWTFSGKKICLDIEKITQNLAKQKEKEMAQLNESMNSTGGKHPKKKENTTLRKSYSIFSACDDFIERDSGVNRINTFSSFDGFGEKEMMRQKKNMEDSREFNSKYILNIDPKKIDYTKYDKETADNLKEFIECQENEETKNNWNIYSNESFISNIFKGEQSEEILSIYILSFIKVVESINCLFKNLLQNTGMIPYSIKCVCKMIYSLLKQKFPDIKRLHLNAFMSRFFFDKLLLPFLQNPIFGALINEYIISPETVKNIGVTAEIISKICSGKLYKSNEAKGNYSPFNNLILDKIIDVYKFYKNFEEIILPEYIMKELENQNDNENANEIKDDPVIQKSICFSIEELYAILKNVEKNKKDLFNDESNKVLSIIFEKIAKSSNMKIIEEIFNEKIYNNDNNEEENNNKNKNKNKAKNKEPKKEIKKIEIQRFYLIGDLITDKQYANVFKINQEKRQFQIKELKNPTTKEDIDKNNIIKVKNIICTILYYLREINVYDFNPISTSLNDTSHIFKEIKNLIKSPYYVTNDTIPFEWYVNSLLQCIGKLPDEYKENDYEMLYKELKDDITKSIESLDISILSNITDKLKYGKRKKLFYENAQKRLVDITLNEKIQYILDKMKVPVELFFCYNDKEKAIRVKEIKKDDNTLKFLDSMVFVEQSKYIKTCNVIKDFTKCFPNIVKSSVFFGENEKILKMLKELEIPKIIGQYLVIVKNKLQTLKIFKNEQEFKDVNNKIYDFVMEKIGDKIFPTFASDNDTELHNLCHKLSWTEPKNFIFGNKNYMFDSFLPDVIYNFLKIEEEKSPRKKLEFLKGIFVCIKQVQDFNGAEGNKAGVDDIINILAYAFVKAQLEMAHTNFEYLKFFVKANSEEDQWLTQLNVVSEFILKINHEKLQVTKKEFDENCEKAFNEFLNK